MCGIIGMVATNPSGFFHGHKSIFNQLLWANTLRGEDSTGVFGVNKYGNVDYLKTVGSAERMLGSNEYDKFKTNIVTDYHFTVGHNRKATKGVISEDNAHPFTEGGVILAHNGTLLNHAGLTNTKVEVDSQAILHSIVERGYEKTLRSIQGAFSLVWYDANKKSLFVTRNDQRPLFIKSTPGAWIFGSEDKMLDWVISRNTTEVIDTTNCSVGTLYEFKLEDKDNMWMHQVDLYKPKVYVPFVKQIEDKSKEVPKDEIVNPTLAANIRLGSIIVVTAEKIIEPVKTNTSYIILGKWFVDPKITVKVFLTETEYNHIKAELEDDELMEDAIFQAEIHSVMNNKGNITIISRTAFPFLAKFDAKGTEILEDEFMLTERKCTICEAKMDFKGCQNGIFDYKSPDEYHITCNGCALLLGLS